MKQIAIYAIRHNSTGRLYIGSSKDVRSRWKLHRTSLRAGEHRNSRLQNAWSKYGESAFDFMVVHEVENEAELLTWEQFWIDRLNPHFNILKIAGSPLGQRHSSEAKARMAAAKRGRKLSDEHRQEIARGLKGRLTSEAHRAALSAATRTNMADPAIREKLSRQNAKKNWRFISPDGELVEFQSLQKFCRDNGLQASAMHGVSTGKYRHYKGWKRAEGEMNGISPSFASDPERLGHIRLEAY